ncbi:hypothetical protein K490DRAFT_63318 [Saccharata proteae CBS 121410]|uniref:Uncharacterized protein n=1 Tax=Saccharata proteae CBS 121410 TaxID=1314787 RepID=A0A9P4HYW0_9PEZI|nr:hypothetical protein K490DRAFT_63318 [Saccharata proteae CBS 121410]
MAPLLLDNPDKDNTGQPSTTNTAAYTAMHNAASPSPSSSPTPAPSATTLPVWEIVLIVIAIILPIAIFILIIAHLHRRNRRNATHSDQESAHLQREPFERIRASLPQPARLPNTLGRPLHANPLPPPAPAVRRPPTGPQIPMPIRSEASVLASEMASEMGSEASTVYPPPTRRGPPPGAFVRGRGRGAGRAIGREAGSGAGNGVGRGQSTVDDSRSMTTTTLQQPARSRTPRGHESGSGSGNGLQQMLLPRTYIPLQDDSKSSPAAPPAAPRAPRPRPTPPPRSSKSGGTGSGTEPPQRQLLPQTYTESQDHARLFPAAAAVSRMPLTRPTPPPPPTTPKSRGTGSESDPYQQEYQHQLLQPKTYTPPPQTSRSHGTGSGREPQQPQQQQPQLLQPNTYIPPEDRPRPSPASAQRPKPPPPLPPSSPPAPSSPHPPPSPHSPTTSTSSWSTNSENIAADRANTLRQLEGKTPTRREKPVVAIPTPLFPGPESLSTGYQDTELSRDPWAEEVRRNFERGRGRGR